MELAKDTLLQCLDTGLRLISPIMPFISEELWQRLPKRGDEKESIHISQYPELSTWQKNLNRDEIDSQFESAVDVVKSIRSLRSDYNLTPKQQTSIQVRSDAEHLKLFEVMIATLASGSSVEILKTDQKFSDGSVIGVVNDKCEIGLDLKGIIDIEKEISKLESKVEQLSNTIKGLEGKMAKPTYAKVPEQVKEKDQAKLTSNKSELEKTRQAIENFKKMKN